MKTGRHERKEENKSKETKWRGREPMKPSLIRNPWADLVNRSTSACHFHGQKALLEVQL